MIELTKEEIIEKCNNDLNKLNIQELLELSRLGYDYHRIGKALIKMGEDTNLSPTYYNMLFSNLANKDLANKVAIDEYNKYKQENLLETLHPGIIFILHRYTKKGIEHDTLNKMLNNKSR